MGRRGRPQRNYKFTVFLDTKKGWANKNISIYNVFGPGGGPPFLPIQKHSKFREREREWEGQGRGLFVFTCHVELGLLLALHCGLE
jgi:hypothetical protein